MKLTHYSHGAGCGCKISPSVLEKMLHSDLPKAAFPSLLVGNESRDDAAVFDLGDGQCIVSTTDFFMPIVDDPKTFGAIASVNAISDVYAMGGEPIMAIAILGWPIDKIAPEVAKEVLEGSRAICQQAGIPLAGGHSIDCPEPVFGLAVTGKVKKQNLKQNNTAREGDLLYLTKPLGIGIVTTAQKKGIVQQSHYDAAVKTMLTLNSIGAKVSAFDYVHAMTDVTGFGLLGHLTEVCKGSNLSASINFDKIPRFDFLEEYISQKSIPGGTFRNWHSYGNNVSSITELQKAILADPQTSGGLLIALDPNHATEFETFMHSQGYNVRPFGKTTSPQETLIHVNN
ncbi:MAG: selenide, water dikinase SelD [Chryseolinea sp.]